MQNTPNKWICDTCGEIIEKAEDGYVEWLSRSGSEKRSYYRLMLVHHSPKSPRERGCYPPKAKDIDLHNPLEYFVGPNGLMWLLAQLSDDTFENREELLEMCKRLHVPGYEMARNNFESAIGDGVFEPNTKPGYYSQKNISATLQWAEKNG
jgi:hypothetical protein